MKDYYPKYEAFRISPKKEKVQPKKNEPLIQFEMAKLMIAFAERNQGQFREFVLSQQD